MKTRRSLKASLVRKLMILDDFVSLETSPKQPRAETPSASLTYRYLRDYPKLIRLTRQGSSAVSTDLDVRILGDVLHLAHQHGREVALSFLEHFNSFQDIDVELIKAIIAGNLPDSGLSESTLHHVDKSLFGIDTATDASDQIRQCYESALAGHGVSLPFSKEPMDRLLKHVKFTSRVKKIENLADLKEFSMEFIFTLWPLFSPNVLTVIFRYFRYQSMTTLEELAVDWDILIKFGFERVLSRLILLRAVNGDKHAAEFSSRADFDNATGISSKRLSMIRRFLKGEESGFEDFELLTHDNPIENAILLSIYVNERDDEIDFLDRLSEAFSRDSSIIYVLNWDELYSEVVNLRYLRSPKIIFLASILTDAEVMSSSRIVAAQYGRGGAGSDLTRVAKYQRNKGATRANFLTSFDELPDACIKSVVDFLFSTGMLDRIANQFPSNTAKSNLVGSSEAFRTLETRDDIISYGRRRRAISPSRADEMLADVREKYRQFRFESNQNEGRIRIRESELASEIRSWLKPRVNIVSMPQSRKNEEFFLKRLEANASLIAPQLARFVCYSGQDKKTRNKFAFDNLLGDKLRHNFISIRFSEKIQPIIDEYLLSDEVVEELVMVVEEQIANFSTEWITIHPGRSFFSDLADEIWGKILMIPKLSRGKSHVLDFLSVSSADLAITHFDRLLKKCREVWISESGPSMMAEIDRLLASDSTMTQVVRDRFSDSLNEAFVESGLWMKVNQDKDPSSIHLRDLITSEAFLLKKQPSFRSNFQVSLFETGTHNGRQSTSKELELPGKFLTTIVAIIDNLVPNACKASGLGTNTPMRVRCIQTNTSLIIEIENKIDTQKASEVLDNVRKAEAILAAPVKPEYLRKTGGGTGFHRIRHAGENEFGEDFEMTMEHDLRAEFQIKIRCTMPSTDARWIGS